MSGRSTATPDGRHTVCWIVDITVCQPEPDFHEPVAELFSAPATPFAGAVQRVQRPLVGVASVLRARPSAASSSAPPNPATGQPRGARGAGLAEGDELARVLVPELEPHRAQTVPQRQRRHVVEHRVVVVRGLEVVVGDPRVEVMDVVQPDVAGEELQHLRQLQVGAAAQRGVGVGPVAVALPEGVLELVLDVEQPDPGGAREQRRRALDQQEVAPADSRTQAQAISTASAMLVRARCGGSAGAPRAARCAGRGSSRRAVRGRTSRAGCGTAGSRRRPLNGAGVVLGDGQRRDVALAAAVEVRGGRVMDGVVVAPAAETARRRARPSALPSQMLARLEGRNEPCAQSWKTM